MTILGKHSVQETIDLIMDNEWRIDAINKAVNVTPPASWVGDAKLPDDWHAFLSRWTDAKFKAKAQIALLRAAKAAAVPVAGLSGAISDDLIPAEDTYQSVLKATSLTYPLYTSTDLPGLQTRVSKVANIDMGKRPGPLSWDFDLSAYKSTDALAKATQQAAATVSKGLLDTIKANPGKTALVVGGAVGGLIALRKLHLL